MLKPSTFGHRTPSNRTAGQKTKRGLSPATRDIEQRKTARRAIWCVTYIYSYAESDPAPRDVREAVLLDVSDCGVRVRSRSRAAFSESVLITVARLGFRRTGRVVWQTGFDAGIEFD